MGKKIREVLASYLRRATKEGFFHIMVGTVLVNCVTILSTLIFPRIMGADYAVFTNANNILNYLILFNGLGLANGILRYCAVFDDPRVKKGYFVYAVKVGFFADFAVILLFGAVLLFLERLGLHVISYGSSGILAILSFTALLVFLQTSIQYFLRANRENKIYSGTSSVYTILYVFFQVGLALLLRPFGLVMAGAAAGRYIAYIAIIGLMLYMMRAMPAFRVQAVKLSRPEKNDMIKYSLNAMLANCFSLIMPINEGLLVAFMVSKADFGDFSAAQIVPNSITYVANAVIVFIFPYFAKNYRDGRWILKNTRKTLLWLSAIMAVVCAVGILLAPEIVLLFGRRFKTPNAIRLMRLFFITYGIGSAVRIPVGNILASIGEVRFNVMNAIFTSTVHFGICWALTRNFGINGAAYGLMIGYAVSGIAGIVYLRYYCGRIERRRNAGPNQTDN